MGHSRKRIVQFKNLAEDDEMEKIDKLVHQQSKSKERDWDNNV